MSIAYNFQVKNTSKLGFFSFLHSHKSEYIIFSHRVTLGIPNSLWFSTWELTFKSLPKQSNANSNAMEIYKAVYRWYLRGITVGS